MVNDNRWSIKPLITTTDNTTEFCILTGNPLNNKRILVSDILKNYILKSSIVSTLDSADTTVPLSAKAGADLNIAINNIKQFPRIQLKAVSYTPPNGPSINDYYYNQGGQLVYRYDGTIWVGLTYEEMESYLYLYPGNTTALYKWSRVAFLTKIGDLSYYATTGDLNTATTDMATTGYVSSSIEGKANSVDVTNALAAKMDKLTGEKLINYYQTITPVGMGVDNLWFNPDGPDNIYLKKYRYYAGQYFWTEETFLENYIYLFDGYRYIWNGTISNLILISEPGGQAVVLQTTGTSVNYTMSQDIITKELDKKALKIDPIINSLITTSLTGTVSSDDHKIITGIYTNFLDFSPGDVFTQTASPYITFTISSIVSNTSLRTIDDVLGLVNSAGTITRSSSKYITPLAVSVGNIDMTLAKVVTTATILSNSDNTNKSATTAFVQAQKISPILTGIINMSGATSVTAPTPINNLITTKVATTGYVNNQFLKYYTVERVDLLLSTLSVGDIVNTDILVYDDLDSNEWGIYYSNGIVWIKRYSLTYDSIVMVTSTGKSYIVDAFGTLNEFVYTNSPTFTGNMSFKYPSDTIGSGENVMEVGNFGLLSSLTGDVQGQFDAITTYYKTLTGITTLSGFNIITAAGVYNVYGSTGIRGILQVTHKAIDLVHTYTQFFTSYDSTMYYRTWIGGYTIPDFYKKPSGSYSIYTATITTGGLGVITINELENTIGVINWTNPETGIYIATAALAGTFTHGKTIINAYNMFGAGWNSQLYPTFEESDTDTIKFSYYDFTTAGLTNPIDLGFIEIKVYN